MLLDEPGREAMPELLTQKWVVVEIGQFTSPNFDHVPRVTPRPH